jgi:hypothetical protein
MASVDEIRVMMNNAQKTYQDLALLLEKAEAAKLAPAVGTKFKWVSDTNPETYRIAVVTNNGFLQVKSVTENSVECDTTKTIGGSHPLIKKLFANEAAWRASLPQGKTEQSFSHKIAEAQRTDEAFKSLSDVEKVDALLKRYKICHRVYQNPSFQERLADTITRLDNFRATMNKLSYDQMLEHGLFKSSRRGFQCLLNVYSWQCKLVNEAGADADKPQFRYGASGTGAVCATINGQQHFITTFEGKIAAVLGSYTWGQVTFYKNFAEMGNPAISVRYRKRTISI